MSIRIEEARNGVPSIPTDLDYSERGDTIETKEIFENNSRVGQNYGIDYHFANGSEYRPTSREREGGGGGGGRQRMVPPDLLLRDTTSAFLV